MLLYISFKKCATQPKTKLFKVTNQKYLWFTRPTWTTLRRLIFLEIYFGEIRLLLDQVSLGFNLSDAILEHFASLNFRGLWNFSNFAWTLFLRLVDMYFLLVPCWWWMKKDLLQHYQSCNRSINVILNSNYQAVGLFSFKRKTTLSNVLSKNFEWIHFHGKQNKFLQIYCEIPEN